MKNKEKEKFDLLYKIIFNFGQKYDKKHGNWIKIHYFKDAFFQMDSWSKAITLKQGNGEYEYWSGFEGKKINYIGLDYGGRSLHISLDLLEFYIENLLYELAKNEYDLAQLKILNDFCEEANFSRLYMD